MDPTTALTNILAQMDEVTQGAGGSPSNLRMYRQAIEEGLDELGAWISRGGFVPNVEVWSEGPGFVCFKVSR